MVVEFSLSVHKKGMVSVPSIVLNFNFVFGVLPNNARFQVVDSILPAYEM